MGDANGIARMFLVIFGGFAILMYLVAIILSILSIIGLWKIYDKAGEPGWKSLIPIYNVYILFKICWKTSVFWIYLPVMIVYLITYMISIGAESSLFLIIAGIFAIAMLVMNVMLYHKLSLAFDHGVGFTLGLIFLSGIFIPILGLGSSEYVGPADY